MIPSIGGTVLIDGYEYQVKSEVIDMNATPASSIEPLNKVHLLLYASIPNELADSFTEGEMVFGFNDYMAGVDITNCDHLYRVENLR